MANLNQKLSTMEDTLVKEKSNLRKKIYEKIISTEVNDLEVNEKEDYLFDSYLKFFDDKKLIDQYVYYVKLLRVMKYYNPF